MIFRQLFDADSCTYTYLIASRGEAVLVDPVRELVERDRELLRELDLKLIATIETHIHADHITGGANLREASGCSVLVPKGSGVRGADRYIDETDVLQLGDIALQPISTPGHTSSHLCYLANDSILLSGDCLFIRGCGRTDFQGGDSAAQYRSLKRLFSLDASVEVYPGHDYRGMNKSTIAEERRWNKRIVETLSGSLRSEEEFVGIMNGLKLPQPKRIMEAVPANERCGLVFPVSQGEVGNR